MLTVNENELVSRFRQPGGAAWVGFVNDLLWAACWQMRIPESAVRATLRTEIPDGGVDTQVMIGSSSDTTGYLGTASIWQYKATDESSLTETSITLEVNKAFAAERIKAGDAYRLCICAHIPADRKVELEKYLASAVHSINANAEEPMLLSAGDVARMASHFPWFVQEFRGVEIQRGTYTLEAWGQNAAARTKTFVASGAFNSHLGQILQHVDPLNIPHDPILPIIGVSGIGKTRCTYEALRTLKSSTGLVLYIDNEKEAVGIATLLATTPRMAAILVVDDCSPATRFALYQALVGHRERVRVLTIQHESLAARQVAPELQIERYSDQEIENIMKANYPGLSPERLRAYVHLSEGYLRLAIDLCEHDNEIVAAKGLAPAEMTARMYYEERAGANRDYISALALFTRVGREGDVENELDSLCLWRGFNRAEVEQRSAEIKESPGFVQRSAVYYRVTPEIIAMQAFDDGWSKWAEGREDRFLRDIQKLPETLQKSFLTRVSRSARQEVREIVRNFFRSFAERFTGDSLGHLDEVLRFRTLIEVDPDFYYRFLRSAIENATDEQLRGPERQRLFGWEPRRQLVYIADQLAQFSAHFADSEAILFRLAEVENEPDLGNNATKTWQRLFRPQLSGTPIPFQDRLATLQSRLPSAGQPLSPLFQGALRALFDFLGTRLLGSAIIAGKIPEPEWRFKTQGDVDGYLESTLTTLWNVAKGRSGGVDEDAANGILLDGIDAIVRNGRLDGVLKTIPTEDLPMTVRAELHSRFGLFLNRSEEIGLPPFLAHDDYREKIVSWLNSMKPMSLVGRLIIEVSTSSWDHYGKEDEWKARLVPIAMELLSAFRSDSPSFKEALDWLHSEKARGAFDLGFKIGELDSKLELLDLACDAAVLTKRTDFARGLIAGNLKVSRDNLVPINAKIDQLQHSSPEIAFYLAHVMGETGRAFERTLEMIRDKKLSPLFLRNFTVWLGTRHTQPPEVRTAIDVLLPYVQEGVRGSADVAIEFIAYQYQRAKPEGLDLGPDFDELAWKIAQATMADESGQGHWWGEIVKRAMVTIDAQRSADLLVQALIGSNFHIEQVADTLLASLANSHPDVVLNALGRLMLDEQNYWKFTVSRFSVFLSLPMDAVARWLEHSGTRGAIGIARHVPRPSFTSDGKPYLHPLTELLLEKYGSEDSVLSEFSAGVHSLQTYVGDISSQKEQEANDAEKFLNHRLPAVRKWAENEMASARQQAEHFRAYHDKARE